MGQHFKEKHETAKQRKDFARNLLKDLEALDIMQNNGMIERGVRRLGAEQEFCLIDDHYQPSYKGPDILKTIEDDHFTTELARFNLEINLDPFEFKGDVYSRTEKQLRSLLDLAAKKAADFDCKILLTGILPSIGLAELDMDYMTPNPRYYRLGEVIRSLKGEDFELSIQGIEDLVLRHDNILFEACNTSFQIHIQCDPDNFVDQYNWAQAISGPVMSVCTNSPLLLGRQLWSETRIALFQQSIDTRSRETGIRQRTARVYFGKDWVRNNITEIYSDDISRFPMLVTADSKDSLKELDLGVAPKLGALALHNGTIWKWNRPCFGSDGKVAHLRIENRYIPSGPTITDEMANMAFWTGLMVGMPDDKRELWKQMDFVEAKENFAKAALNGIDTILTWDGQEKRAARIVLEDLLPIAEAGLKERKVDDKDIDRLLGVISERSEKGITGSKWILKTYRSAPPEMETLEKQTALTRALVERREGGKPIAQWSDYDLSAFKAGQILDKRVDKLMTTDLYTVREDDLVELVALIMKWHKIRHVPVEDHQGNLRGLITRTQLEKVDLSIVKNKSLPVNKIMLTNATFVGPSVNVKEAMEIMLREKIGCLPVVEKGKLIGILTEVDMNRLWEKTLRQG